MDIIIFVLTFFFSIFFILLAYWKEDLILLQIGSISFLIISLVLLGTGIQIMSQGTNTLTVNNTGSVENYTITSNNTENVTNFYENIIIGIMLCLFDIMQYFYFSARFSEAITKGELP